MGARHVVELLGKLPAVLDFFKLRGKLPTSLDFVALQGWPSSAGRDLVPRRATYYENMGGPHTMKRAGRP